MKKLNLHKRGENMPYEIRPKTQVAVLPSTPRRVRDLLERVGVLLGRCLRSHRLELEVREVEGGAVSTEFAHGPRDADLP